MEKQMLKIVFFARLRELMDFDEIDIDLSKEQIENVADALNMLSDKYNQFNDYMEQGNRLMIAVNQEIGSSDKKLIAGDELALFPPVTGG